MWSHPRNLIVAGRGSQITVVETFTGQGTRWMGTKQPRAGVQDDQAANRVKDMDDEGTDTHLLIPTSWVSVVGLPCT